MHGCEVVLCCGRAGLCLSLVDRNVINIKGRTQCLEESTKPGRHDGVKSHDVCVCTVKSLTQDSALIEDVSVFRFYMSQA